MDAHTVEYHRRTGCIEILIFDLAQCAAINSISIVSSKLFHIEKFRDEIVEMEGFGVKSFENMLAAVEKARNVSVPRFLYSLGIPNIGTANAKLIAQHCQKDSCML